MARFSAFFTLFHLSLTFFQPEVPFKGFEKVGHLSFSQFLAKTTIRIRLLKIICSY